MTADTATELQAPLPGNVLQTVVDLDHYEGPSGRFDTEDVDAAQVTTSMVAETWDPTEGNSARPLHRPVLDLDFPAQLIPSSTPGHFHLYLDREIEHEKYMRLLDALADCGLIEDGYRNASQERGYTAVRLPWVKKQDPDQEDGHDLATELAEQGLRSCCGQPSEAHCL